jgi:AcrR family transcriptional regulator
MITVMEKRKYTLRKRAERQEDTRARIVEAMIAVHEELGPRDATVSAIAERAGVQRLTVYRHFPDDESLFAACTAAWSERHPPPDPADLAKVPDAFARTRQGLESLYRYYRGTRRMWAVSYRDVQQVPAIQAYMAEFERYLDGFRDMLLRGWPVRGRRRNELAATLTLALRFRTWESLEAQGLDDGAMAALVMGWLACLRRESA